MWSIKHQKTEENAQHIILEHKVTSTNALFSLTYCPRLRNIEPSNGWHSCSKNDFMKNIFFFWLISQLIMTTLFKSLIYSQLLFSASQMWGFISS